MPGKIIIALCSLAMLAATFAVSRAPAAQAQSGSDLRIIAEFEVPNSRDTKYPHVVAGNDIVHVTGNANRSTAYAWTKAATANSFPAAVELGPAEGQPDFSTTSVAKGPDGSVYVAWVNQGSRTIFMRQRSPAGTWGATRTVDRSSDFPVKPEIGVNSTGQLFVAWRDPDRPIRYRLSNDGGVNWSSARNVSDTVAYDSAISLSGGPNGAMAVSFTAGEGNRLQVFVGLWGGNGFTVQRITTLGGDYADSTVSIGPDGKVYAAWRGVAESGGNSGVFYAERAADGSWPRSRLAGGRVTGTASVNADEAGNLHFTWLAQPSGGNQIFYAFKPANEVPRGPIGSDTRGALFNSRGFGSVATGTYNHAVTEQFGGAGLRAVYSLFQANQVSFGGEPVIENDAPRTFRSADNAVLVTFRNVVGTPNQVRYAWNRAPNDADPWQPFATTMRVAVPDSIYSSTSCAASTLYTQLRNSTNNQIEAQPRSDTVQIDGVVEVAVSTDNAAERAADEAQISRVQGAPGGDERYTRYPLVYLSVVPLSDCNGLTTLGVGPTPDTVETSYAMSDAGFQGTIPLPDLDDLVPGKETPFYVRITDGAGNVRVFGFTVIIDEEKPILNTQSPGQAVATPSRLGDILQDLSFTNLNIRDDIYQDPNDPDPNRRFWGFWIANSPEPLDNPLNTPGLRWTVVEAPPSVAVPGAAGTDYVVNLRSWSLATGLSREQQAPGDFYIYVRFLDGAGNPTDDYLTIPVAASQMQLVKGYVPNVNR